MFLALLTILLAAVTADFAYDHHKLRVSEVTMSGYDVAATRDFPSTLRAKDVANLRVHWNVSQCGGAVSPPIIKNGRTCSTDYAGCISCYNTVTGTLLWRKNVSEYNLPNRIYSRTIAYSSGMILFVTAGIIGNRTGYGTWLVAVDFYTTDLVWKTQLSSSIWTTGTSNPLVVDGFVYVGLSSSESAGVLTPGHVCCETVSKMLEVRLRNGDITMTVPSFPLELSGVGKYSGGSIWGQLAYHKDHLYYGTGQLYQAPNASAECAAANPQNTSCVPPLVRFDSIIKLEVARGRPGRGGIVASVRTQASDTWNVACLITSIPGCQPGPALDYDVTNLIISVDTNQLFGTAKSGVVWALDLDTLALNWIDFTVQGYIYGGYIYQGALRDNKDKSKLRLVLSNNNGGRYNFTLLNGTVVNTGLWLALDGNGNKVWTTGVPGGGALGDTAFAGVAITNDVVVAATRYEGLIALLNLDTGAILRTISTGGSMSSTPSIGRDGGIYYACGAGSLALSFNRPLKVQSHFIKIAP